MVTSAVQLAEGFYPQDIRPWYDGADVGESITIALPSRVTTVRLIKRPKHYVSVREHSERVLHVLPIEIGNVRANEHAAPIPTRPLA